MAPEFQYLEVEDRLYRTPVGTPVGMERWSEVYQEWQPYRGDVAFVYLDGIPSTTPQHLAALTPAERSDIARRAWDTRGRSATLSPSEFESQIPKDEHLWRGVHSPEGAAVTRAGQLGSGDFGEGIYFSKMIGTAQGYAQQYHGAAGGVILRAAIRPGAKVAAPPRGIMGSEAIDRWAARNKVDVVNLDPHYVVRNPKVLIWDSHDYTLRESVVKDYQDAGWTMPDGYEKEVERLKHLADAHPLTSEERSAASKKAWESRSHGAPIKTAPVESPEEAAYRAQFKSIDRRRSVVLFHGTSSQAIAAIKRQGLRPHAGKGGDAWAKQQGQEFDIEGRQTTVFLTQWVDTAEEYGQHARAVNPNSESVILQITIPKAYTQNLVFDEASDPEEGAWKYNGPIPPAWIKLVTEHEYNKPPIVQKLAADVDAVLYAVFSVDRTAALADAHPLTVETHLVALTPEERSDIARRAWDTRGRTVVGITSQRSGAATKPNRLVFKEMDAFASQLQKLPGVQNARIVPGVGVWQDTETKEVITEPSWVVSFNGNGDALRLIAQTGKDYDQQAVLITRPAGSAEGTASPVVEFEFDTPLTLAKQKAMIAAMAIHGITGAAWSKRNGKTVMRAVAVPQWGQDAAAHLKAAREVSDELTARGVGHRTGIDRVMVDVLEQSGASSYDAVLTRGRDSTASEKGAVRHRIQTGQAAEEDFR